MPPRDVFILCGFTLSLASIEDSRILMMPWWKPLAIFYLLSPRSKDHVEQVAGAPFSGHGWTWDIQQVGPCPTSSWVLRADVASI